MTSLEELKKLEGILLISVGNNKAKTYKRGQLEVLQAWIKDLEKAAQTDTNGAKGQ